MGTCLAILEAFCTKDTALDFSYDDKVNIRVHTHNKQWEGEPEVGLGSLPRNHEGTRRDADASFVKEKEDNET